MANLILIHKKETKTLFQNNRPIYSLFRCLSNFARVFETVLYNSILCPFYSNGLFTK